MSRSGQWSVVDGLPFFLGAVFVMVSGGMRAQGVDAVLTGMVRDPSGAAIVGASIRADHTASGVVSRTSANEAGVFVFAALPAGVYRVTAEHPGFRPFTYSDVTLEVGGRLSLDFSLTVGALTESIEVKATAENLLGYDTSSAGGMLTGQKILDLPVTARDSLALIYTQAGITGNDNIAGNRIGALNITLDGINVQDQRLNQGISSPIFTSVDKVEEFRVVISPADAELGRGSAQILMLSRSGSNRFRGSLFEFHRNTVLNANTWFNNQRGNDPITGAQLTPRNPLIRNQYGGRLGGPIRRNQTFFHVLLEGQRVRQRTTVTNTSYTATARQGIYRFFPGVRNGNAESSSPVVDLNGNPLTSPAGATGALQSVSLFGRDPRRTGPDPSGVVKRMLDLTPLPNNFRSGDGLNYAGYTWQRPSSQDLDQLGIKIDHNLSAAHRLAFGYTHENRANLNLWSVRYFPDAPNGETIYRNRFASLNLWSNLGPSLLNEFRAGVLRPWLRYYSSWETEKGKTLIPTAGGYPYGLDFSLVTDPINLSDDPVGRISPLYQFTDNLTWIRGKHSFKGGFEIRFSSSNGFNSANVLPRVVLGTGTTNVQGLDTIPGIGTNLANAISMLNELSGSVSSMTQALHSPGGSNPQYVPGEVKQRTWKRREMSVFFKDDIKLSRNVTLNLGVRWEYYGVPYDRNGRTAALVGGASSIFGISGTSSKDLFQPGHLAGQMTRVELVGPNSPNPSRQVHGDDYNNFGPAAGLTWAPSWFHRKLVLRAGYSIGYERDALRLTDAISGSQPGLLETVNRPSSTYTNLTAVTLPLAPAGKPFELVPLTDRSQTVRTFDDNLRSPYVQSWNFSVQREVARNTVMEVRYVGTKATKLVRGFDINEQNIFENGILEAFLVTQAGGNAPLLNRIFNGLNISGLGRVDGITITGSDAVRTNTTTQSYLANHNVASFADWLNTTTSYTNERGGLLRRAGLPENFVTANPQFDSARITGNVANSTWHSMQLELARRFSSGWTFQGNYTFSKALGEEEGAGEEMVDSYRNLRNLRMDKRLLSFHRTHVFRNSGTYELPFGPRGHFLTRGGWLGRLVEGWQFGAIYNIFSGNPVSITSGRSTWNTFGDNTASAVVAFSSGAGHPERLGNGVTYFRGYTQVKDPSIAALTTKNGIQGRSILLAVADPSGRVTIANPTPGTVGNLALNYLSAAGSFRLDVNLIKRVALRERFSLDFRVDAIDVTNSPQWNDPNTDINSVNFGRITGAGGNRILVVGARMNF